MNMKLCRSLAVLTFCLLVVPTLQAQTKKLTTAEAKDHVGDRATVCGKVASTHYAQSSNGEPTFLNLDEPYPKEVFTILIWGSDREKLGTPEDEYKALRVCVTGKLTSYRGRPEIVATERDQIEIQK
jgi:DNA/RNA endonuclease YhcR with UshA esterase domain